MINKIKFVAYLFSMVSWVPSESGRNTNMSNITVSGNLQFVETNKIKIVKIVIIERYTEKK